MVLWRASVKDLLYFPGLLCQFQMSSVRMSSAAEIQLPVPWGHISGKSWGNPSGRHVLAVHGWLDNAGSFDKLVPLLSPDLNVVAIDWPGHGKSSHRPRGALYNAFDYVADIQYAVDALEWKKFSLLGHSLGAGVCTWYAGAQPDVVEQLVLIEGGTFNSYQVADVPEMMGKALRKLSASNSFMDSKTFPTWESVVDKVLEGHRLSQSSFSREAAAVLAVRGTHQLDNGEYRFTRDLRLRQPSLLRVTADMNNAFWNSIKCPVLFIRAEDSYISSLLTCVLEKLDSRKFQLVSVPGGHHVHLESPERIHTALDSFLGNIKGSSEQLGKL